jgi:hypothetical protein
MEGGGAWVVAGGIAAGGLRAGWMISGRTVCAGAVVVFT